MTKEELVIGNRYKIRRPSIADGNVNSYQWSDATLVDISTHIAVFSVGEYCVTYKKRNAERSCTMSIRGTFLKDYGISKELGDKIVSYCRNAHDYDQNLILQAAQKTCPEISSALFANLTLGIGYDRISQVQYIPMQRKDFQGYRRKTIEELYRLLLLHGKEL